MARQLFLGPKTSTEKKLDASQSRSRVKLVDPVKIEARLRAKRSKGYLECMTALDAGGHVHNQAAFDALIEALENEFPEIEIDALPIGIVAKCYLGAPYEVHTLDRMLRITKHYEITEALPGALNDARRLALHPAYAFIEVYTDKLIAVSTEGQTSIITR